MKQQEINRGTGPVILIVCDDSRTMTRTRQILKKAGYQVKAAKTAAEAKRQTHQHNPALILLEKNLPDGNGMELVREIKQIAGPSAPFVILCTVKEDAGPDVSPADKLSNGIADGYLFRPVGKEELLARVDAAIRTRDALNSLRQSYSFQKTVLSELSVPVFYTDEQGQYTGCNTSFSDLFGISEPKLIGQSIYDDVPVGIADLFPAVHTLSESYPGVITREGTIQDRHSMERAVLLHVSGIYSSRGFSGYTGAIVDITEKVRIDDSLRQANMKLKLLTGITRHEIVNELSIINLALELAKDSDDPAYIREKIGHALEAARNLDDSIAFTREYEEFGSVSSRWNRIHPMVTNAVRQIVPHALKVEISIPDDTEIFADPLIQKIFVVIFDNAIRHGRSVHSMSVSGEEDESGLLLIFEDDGIGVQDEEKERIFTHGYGDHTGFGLFLTREILSLTHVGIQETGTPGKGARFEISVPAGNYRFSGR